MSCFVIVGLVLLLPAISVVGTRDDDSTTECVSQEELVAVKTEMEKKVDQLNSQLQFWQGVTVDSIFQDHCSSLNTESDGTGAVSLDSICIEESAVIAVSTVSFLLIVTLITVSITQCLFIIRMKRSNRKTISPLSNRAPIPLSPNEACGLAENTSPQTCCTDLTTSNTNSIGRTIGSLDGETHVSVSPNEAYGLVVKRCTETCYMELTTSNTKLTDIPVSLNEAYELVSITN